MKKTACAFLVVFAINNAFSQYEQKYWNYRERFTKYFTFVGGGIGESNVADRRNYKFETDTASGADKITHGDQTTNLGDYIAMLATEYKLLNDAGQDVSQASKELYYALYAFNRLDEIAETYFNLPAELNGFFVRQDVPVDEMAFVTTHPDINIGLLAPIPPYEFVNYNVGSGMPQWITKAISGFNPPSGFSSDCNAQKSKRSTDLMSPDQVIGLYFGMAMVVKCVPPAANYNGLTFQDGNVNFVDAARNITDRITTWMQNHNWEIKSPTGCKLWGTPSWMRYAFGVAAGEIMGNHDKYLDITTTSVNWCSINAALNAHESLCNYVSEWEMCDIEYNYKIVIMLAAIGNSWDCLPVGSDTYERIVDHSSTYNNWKYFYPLIHTILHWEGNNIQQSEIEFLLGTAPFDGPFNHEPMDGIVSDRGLFGWCTPFLFRADNNEQINGAGARGNFHGLDFMLLHNMYKIIYKPTCDATADLLVTAGGTIPPTLNYLPNTTVSAKNSIVTIGSVSPLPGQTWRAGDYIDLNPGFETLPGQTWEATIGGCNELFDRLANPDSTKNKGGETDTAVQKEVRQELYVSRQENNSAIEPAAVGSPVSGKNRESSINNPQSLISITPNPSDDGKFNLTCTLQEVGCMDAEITVMNALGQTIRHEPLNHYTFPVSIDLSAQPKGAYFIKIQNAEKVFVQKLISR